MPRRQRPLPCALAAGFALLVTAGCGNSTGTRPTAAARSGSAQRLQAPAQHTSGPPVSTHPAPTAAPADRTVEQVATRYLAVRENAISYTHPTARSWLGQVRPLMTQAGWRHLTATLGGDGGYLAATARQHRWSVLVTVGCRNDPDAGPATTSDTTLICEVKDRTVDTTGIPIPASRLPTLWLYNGPQPPTLLALHNQADHWLVAADQTGQAG